ncbi:MAG: IdeS/Mac family cysteine endopeptidase [Alistipes sp.]|nr:IdeS/Mac family cysteine endopeptidase [Alistipes sp.]
MKRLFFALVAMLGFVACDTKEPVVEYELNLLVDKAEIIANGEDVVTFIVEDWDGNVLEDATIHFADTHEALAGKTFKTKYPGEYEFYAKRGTQKSEVWQVYAKENNGDEPVPPGPDPLEKELKLTVEPSTIYVDETATFTVEYDGNDVSLEATIYLADGDVALDGNTFTATTEGVYTFYAKYEDATSDSVNVNVRMQIVEEEKPIEIEATTLTIKANGVDYTKFTVTQDGANITDQSTIYVNGGVLNGSRFVTTTPGKYSVYAVKGEQKSNELTITAEEVTSTGKTIVFAEGVTLTSGWYDVNKKGAGDNGDINMCWAAASANMIQWFQDRYKAAGKTLPAGAVDGPGVTTYTNYGPYELELMSMYHSEWDNSRGGHMQEAIPWYFEGKLNGGEFASPGSQAVPKTAGGYWKSIWDSEVYPYVYHEYENVIVPGVEGLDLKNLYITIFNNYYLWGNGTSYQGTERLAEFSKLVVEIFRHGMAGLTVNLGANLTAVSHAATLWGYEIDNATGLITRLWITDSDDLMSEPKTPMLNEYNVSVDDGKSNIKLSGNTRYGACYVVSLHPFAGYGSAE